MMSQFKGALRRLLRQSGRDVIRYTIDNCFHLRRAHILAASRVEMVLDVGAHVGTYASEIRQTGYRGKILSFEPRLDAYGELSRRASRDPRWECIRAAVGSSFGTTQINVSRRSTSSSLLEMTGAHLAAMPGSAIERIEEVPLVRLDDLLGRDIAYEERLWLKADVQGYEAHVLDGAESILQQVVGMELELSLFPVYRGAPDFIEMLARLRATGFYLVGMQNVFSDRSSGYLLQMDGIFIRRSASEGNILGTQ